MRYFIVMLMILILVGCADEQSNVHDNSTDIDVVNDSSHVLLNESSHMLSNDSSHVLSNESQSDVKTDDIQDETPVEDTVPADDTIDDDIPTDDGENLSESGDSVTEDIVDGEIDFEKLCTTKIPADAKHVNTSSGGSYVDYYELSDGSFVGPKWKWYDNEKKQRLSFRCFDADGRKNGPAADWDKNGNLETSYAYKDERFDGFYREYEDGLLVDEDNYDEGTMVGTWKKWDSDGVLESIENYKDGEKNGTWQTYFDNGNLKEEQVYDMGIKTASYKSFYEDGSPQVERSGTTEFGKLTGISIRWGTPNTDGKQSGTKCNVVDGVNQDCEEVTR